MSWIFKIPSGFNVWQKIIFPATRPRQLICISHCLQGHGIDSNSFHVKHFMFTNIIHPNIYISLFNIHNGQNH